MEKIEINRTGMRPLHFCGKVVGQGSSKFRFGSRQNRWSEVSIYVSERGRYICQVDSVSEWANEPNTTEAVVLGCPEGVVGFLVGRTEDGKLGQASQEAIERACLNDEAFAAYWPENVE